MDALLTFDPGVPQRDLLLNRGEMARRLSWKSCEPLRARYQVGRSLRVLYRVSIGGPDRLVALRTFPGERSGEVYRHARENAVPGGSLPGIAHAADLGAVLFTFPNDRKVAGLQALVRHGRLVSYAPEKCATARVVDGYAKAYAGDEGERTRRIHDWLHAPAARAGLRLPRAIAYSAAQRTLVCEAIPGRALAELDGAERVGGMRRLGGALAALHGLAPPSHAPAFERVRPRRLAEAVATIERARPDCAGAAHHALARLLETVPGAADTVCLHGDVHPKNAVIAGGSAALIDLDQVSAGPAAGDVGSMLAALRYGRIVGDLTLDQERAQADAFVAGYTAVREPPDPAVLRWHVAAALLAERALRAVTRVRPGGLARLPDVLAEATP